MGRSLRKGPYVCPKLYKKVKKAVEASGARARIVIRTWERGSTIFPLFLDVTFMVHNGKEHIPVLVTEQMIGHKLGEFALTRLFRAHPGDKKVETKRKGA